MYKNIFIDSKQYRLDSDIDEKDISFFTSKKLINISNNLFKINFVGEIKTPYNSYFSVPKNFSISNENIEILKKLLMKYLNLKKR